MSYNIISGRASSLFQSILLLPAGQIKWLTQVQKQLLWGCSQAHKPPWTGALDGPTCPLTAVQEGAAATPH